MIMVSRNQQRNPNPRVEMQAQRKGKKKRLEKKEKKRPIGEGSEQGSTRWYIWIWWKMTIQNPIREAGGLLL